MTVLQRGLSRPATISKQGPGSPKKPGAPSIPQSHRGMGGKPRTSCERIASVCLSPRIRMTCHPEHLYSHLQVTAEMNIPHGKAPRRGRRRIAQDKRSEVLGTRPKFPRALGGGRCEKALGLSRANAAANALQFGGGESKDLLLSFCWSRQRAPFHESFLESRVGSHEPPASG